MKPNGVQFAKPGDTKEQPIKDTEQLLIRCCYERNPKGLINKKKTFNKISITGLWGADKGRSTEERRAARKFGKVFNL
jgi:hypothetical protein